MNFKIGSTVPRGKNPGCVPVLVLAYKQNTEFSMRHRILTVRLRVITLEQFYTQQRNYINTH